MKVISYAPNFEDVLLARAFRDIREGFYIDIGARDPLDGSVSKFFYDSGWSGINIVLSDESLDRLTAGRPRDINLHTPGAVAQALASLCREHAPQSIEFLRVCVPGSAAPILESGDWETYRPQVLLCEEHGDGGLDGLLAAVRYQAVYFDGINRWYVREESAALRAVFATPPNNRDGFVPYALHRACIERDEALAESQRLEALLSSSSPDRGGSLQTKDGIMLQSL
ncbi:MAG TPA: hypothetical protein VHM24_00405, partial [Gemmatimonadaceae bacterium]|nr:hypothetical protein [Gemmatimonadaceae bacterium]